MVTPAANKMKTSSPYYNNRPSIYNNRPSIKSSLPKHQTSYPRANKIPAFIKLRKDKNNANRSASPH